KSMKQCLAYAALLAAFGTSAYDNPLEVNVESGESSLEASQLAGRDAIVKTGGGTLVLPSIPDFAGDIAIRQGIVKVASEGALGTADGKTIVAPGAQLYIDAAAADLDFSAEPMEIASLNGSVAVYVKNKSSNKKNLGTLKLVDDATVYFANHYGQGANLGRIHDLDGHTLTLRGNFVTTRMYFDDTFTAGNFVVDKSRFILSNGFTSQGNSENTIRLENGGKVCFYWLANPVPLKLVSLSDDSKIEIWSRDGLDGKAGVYAGPIDLSEASLHLGRDTNDDRTRWTCAMTLSGKISGAGGLTAGVGDEYSHFTAFITNPENDFQGGASFREARVHLPVSGALPRDGGALYMKDGTLVLTNELAYALPSATFEGTGVVQGASATGSWKKTLTKKGDGNLEYDTYLDAPVLDLQGGAFTLPTEIVTVITNRQPGLYGGGRTFDTSSDVNASWNDRVTYTNGNVYLSPEMAYKAGTTQGWADNTIWTYQGTIWNRNATNEQWTFASCILARGCVYLDGNLVVMNDSPASANAWGGVKQGSVDVAPGSHSIEIRLCTGSGCGTSTMSGGGAYYHSSALGNVHGTEAGYTWAQYSGIMLDRLGRRSHNVADYSKIVDSGDGHLLTLADDADTVIRKLPVFDTVVATNAAATLDLNGNDYTVNDLVGFPSLVNAGTFTVNNDWRLTFIGTVTCDGKVVFASDATLTVDARTPAAFGRSGENEWIIMTAEGGIEGCPRLNAPDVKGTWKVSVDGNAVKLSFAPKGLSVIIR
ncbi:MAG: hypothetical protein IKJ37_16145, partial [Kiritimatiellae bacterium]|nr:hypothetical protein [Kiritimatiellia bacterium]